MNLPGGVETPPGTLKKGVVVLKTIQKVAALLSIVTILCTTLGAPVAASSPSAAMITSVENANETGISCTYISSDGDITPSEGMLARIAGSGTLQLGFNVPVATDVEVVLTYRVYNAGTKGVQLGAVVNEEDAWKNGMLWLPRVFRDGGVIKQDAAGNDIKPQQVQIEEAVTAPLRIDDHRRGEQLTFKAVAGANTVTLDFKDQKIDLINVEILPVTELEKYIAPTVDVSGVKTVTIQGEHATFKSDSMLYPISDLTSAATTPSHYQFIKLNTIGGSNWQTPGQWIEWEIPIEESGYYTISFRVRQNIARGMESRRRIYIDGSVPFAELMSYSFPYNRSWQAHTLGDRENGDYYIYLEKGKHTLRMEALMGERLETDALVADAVSELNSLYRKIIMITGTTPDLYRTYNLHKQIPNLAESFLDIADRLRAEVSRIEGKNDVLGSELSFMNQLALQLENFAEDSDLIPNSLDTFKSNISTLSSLLTTLRNQPLEIDSIVVAMKEGAEVKADAGFFVTIWHEFRRFLASFVADYTSMQADAEGVGEPIDVWTLTGRDQAQVLRNMIVDTFTPQTGIRVNLSFIQTGLLEATMAGKGPDVAIGVGRTQPVDMGVRGVLLDLSTMPGFDDLRSRFQESAFNPYTYNGKVYALPETQECNVMYVRTDILESFGLGISNTWHELMGQIAILSQYNMEIGIPQTVISTLLLQSGMTYYDQSGQKTVFSSHEAYDVYEVFVQMFREYECPQFFDASNRFRTGEMPIVIAGFSFFNTLSVLAPEIKGLWDIYPIPGTLKDGEINHTTDATGMADVIFSVAGDRAEDAFTFLTWWTDAEAQLRYATELENMLGPAGRYPTANLEAFSGLNWSADQQRIIAAQRKWVYEMPEVPGSYIVSRNINNMFIDMVVEGSNIRESLLKYSRQMDEELARKFAEIESILATN